MKKYIEAGQITRPHGIQGAVKAEPWCDSPEVLARLKKVYFRSGKDEYREIKVEKGSVQKDLVILKLSGVDTPESAEKLRGKIMFADRADIPIPEGAFLIADLIGLPVIDINDGRIYGKLSDVITGGANDIYEISRENGKVLIPAVKEFIKETDLEKGIFISPIKGMFDED